jgi:hypothetical protein
MTKDDVAAATSPPPAEQTGGGQIPDQADQGTQQRQAYSMTRSQGRPRPSISKGARPEDGDPQDLNPLEELPPQQRGRSGRGELGELLPGNAAHSSMHLRTARTPRARAEPGPSPPQADCVPDEPSADQVDESDLRAAAQVTPLTHPPPIYRTLHRIRRRLITALAFQANQSRAQNPVALPRPRTACRTLAYCRSLLDQRSWTLPSTACG